MLFGKLMIAVVHDDPRLLESLSDLLESAGYAVRSFRCARSFLDDNAALSETDCLIADIGMPHIDGFELADSLETDTRLLNGAMTRSLNAAGILEATQAGNELTALGVKQSLALQGLLTAQLRAETLARARDLATENEARQRFKTFVGTGSAYTPDR